jgi:5-oxoprolinase (ATP-hydrolysing)
LTRPPSIVAAEVHRRLVTVSGAAKNYGVVVRPFDYSVNEGATNELRRRMREQRQEIEYSGEAGKEVLGYDRGGKMKELMDRCEEETGLPAPKPQWEGRLYGPHVGLPYVQEWYARMKKEGLSAWDF